MRWFWLGFILLAFWASGVAAQYRKPTPQQVAHVKLGQGLSAADLERIAIGHQAGVLKVLGKDGQTVKFIKGGDGLFGIDGREWAPLSALQRDGILAALEIEDPNAMASSLRENYHRVSRAHALALLGVLAHPGESSQALNPEVRAKSLKFIRSRLQPLEDNIVRRQAVVALAIQPKTDAETVASMLNFLRRDHNAWNTFGVVQFFEYQREPIQAMPQFQGVLTQLLASGSPHAEQIVALLRQPTGPAGSAPSVQPPSTAEPVKPPQVRPSPVPLPPPAAPR